MISIEKQEQCKLSSTRPSSKNHGELTNNVCLFSFGRSLACSPWSREHIVSFEDFQVSFACGSLSERALHLLAIFASHVKLANQLSQLIRVHGLRNRLDVVQHIIDLFSARLTAGEVVDVLDAALDRTPILLDCILRSLLCLLVRLTVSLGDLLFSLLLDLGFLSGLLLCLSFSFRSLLFLELLLILVLRAFLPELLNSLIHIETVINHLPQTCDILILVLTAGIGVLFLDVALVVAAFVVVRDVFVEVFESAPAIEIVPEVVECLDILFARVLIAQNWNWLDIGEAGFGLKHSIPFFVEIFGLVDLFLCGWFNIGVFINRVELSAFGRVGENFVSTLDAFEELIVL